MGESDLAVSEALQLLAVEARLAAAATTEQVVEIARHAARDAFGLELQMGAPPDAVGDDVPICAAGQVLGVLRMRDRKPLPRMRRLAVAYLAATTGAALRATQRLAAAERQASHDPLTGLLNRRGLNAELDTEVHRARRLGYTLGVLMIDVDDFKSVNDRFGHGAGDETLRRLGALLSGSLRRTDQVARLGGEEFVVVLPGAGPDATLLVAQKLRRAVAQLPEPRITLSLGAAAQSSAAVDGQTLLARADLALYAAKRAGRDQARLWEGSDA